MRPTNANAEMEINGANLATTNGTQTVNGANITLNSPTAATCTFAAHSMTAIELCKQHSLPPRHIVSRKSPDLT